ncbi:hypothetical protein Pyn_31309 [Prunus yedoensis var. nudiflora]|uniref:Exostosin GT47 domain-containing protein n=1 Tax=Prunus yedoensis var. nudiflora TaxID=2094558 RepID=A0A314YB13_PRUYE|nr:hypothetical protein Pyn_31309 [Prunus yedoensis var. nudiflora]
MHGRVRPTLLKHWQDKHEDMKIYGPLPLRVSRKMSYIQHMKSSKFCICPMGYEVNSPRIIESIYYECVPVIIADNFPPPLSDVLDWSKFSVAVAEKDIPKLREILVAIPMRRYLTMQINVKMVQKHFLWNPRPIRYDLFHMILHSIWSSRTSNSIWCLQPGFMVKCSKFFELKHGWTFSGKTGGGCQNEKWGCRKVDKAKESP